MRREWIFAWALGLAACSSRETRTTEAALGDAPWIVDYEVEGKHGASHLRIFENGERLLIETRCCPRRQVVPELRPLTPDELATYQEMVKLVAKEGTRVRPLTSADIRSGRLRVRDAHGERVLREFSKPEEGTISRFRFAESDSMNLLLDEIEPDMTWTLPR